MKLKKASQYLATFVLLGAGSVVNAATTVQFYAPYSGGIADNLSDAAGLAGINGMRWGIIVDTLGDGFDNANVYDAYLSNPNTTSGFFSAAGAVTDDYFIAGALTVDASMIYPSGDLGGTTPGDGSIIDDIAVNYTNGISLGDKFALIWFATSSSAVGDRYGFLSDASFVLPSDGGTVPYTTPFEGTDPIRSASLTFQGIPEPSRMVLLGIGFLGLCFRRRR